METKELDQTIKVGAIFSAGGGSAFGGKGDIRPSWFVWEGRKYPVKEINYVWMDRQGREKLYCFAVTDGANNYELSFNAEQANWKLNKVCAVS